MNELIIGDNSFIDPSLMDGTFSRGLVPRDMTAFPVGSFAPPAQIQLLPRSEWSDRIRQMESSQSRLSDVRGAIPSLDQNEPNSRPARWGYCFPAGTRIKMGDGTHKNIEDVKLLDVVLTAEGTTRRVMQCHVREHDGEMVTVKTFGHGHLRLTPNHEVLTNRGYVPAGNLQSGDMVSLPRYAPSPCSVVMTSEHARARVRVLPNGSTVKYRCKAIPELLTLTPGVGRIFGLWLAEGHTDKSVHEVVWSFSEKETDTLAAELVELLQSEWGIEASISDGPSPNVTQVKFRGTLWCQLFSSLCGRLAGGKKLHRDLASGPREFLEALFWGWMAGDGCLRGNRMAHKTGATISHDLALAMYDIANVIGLNPVIHRESPQVNRHAKTRRVVWKVSVNVNPSTQQNNWRVESDPATTWRRTHRVESEPFKGTVFNIGVEGENSYVAEGIGVHNCWSYATAGAWMLLRAVMNQPYVRPSAFGMAYTIKNGKDEGAWGALSLDFAIHRGIPSDAVWPNFQRRQIPPAGDPVWQDAAKYKVTDGYMELGDPVYDRDLNFDQMMTLLLNRVPVVVDLMWWGHCVVAIDPVETSPGKFGIRILNSWGDGWSERGMGILTGSKAIPDNAVAPSVVLAT